MALKKQQRLRGRRNVSAVFSKARPLHRSSLTIRVLRRNADSPSFAVIVPSGTVRLATKRNTLRRRISEILRTLLMQHEPSGGAHVVITVRSPVLTAREIREALVLLLEKSGILQK